MRRVLVLIAALATLAAVAGCGSDESDVRVPEEGEITTPGFVDLEGTTWELTSGSLNLPGVDEHPPTLRLLDGQASGFTGCNQFSGTYTTTGDSIRITGVAMTAMACPPAESAIEQAYVGRLDQAATYELTGTGLVLRDGAGSTVLTFAEAESSLVGDWVVTGYLMSSGSAFTSVVGGTQLTALFGADGTVSGSGGCNSYRGPWTQGPANAVTIGPLASTRMACLEAEISEQETSFLAALESSSTADVTSRDAVLLNAAGQRVVTLTR